MMDALLPVLMMFVVAAATAWFYWQSQKAEERMTATAAQLADQATLIGEMVDEVCAASQHLYAEMDRWQALVDGVALHTGAEQTAPGENSQVGLPVAPPVAQPRQVVSADTRAVRADSSPLHGAAQTDRQATAPGPATDFVAETAAATEPDAEPVALKNESPAYSPYLHALKLAQDGVPRVEIARQTGIGTEELRLLLRFQEEINSPA